MRCIQIYTSQHIQQFVYGHTLSFGPVVPSNKGKMSAPPSELYGAIFKGGVKESEAEYKPMFGAVMSE